MPSSVVTSFAPKYAKAKDITEEEALEKLEKLWDRAKTIARKNEDFEEEDDRFWSYVMGIWKRMVSYDNDGVSESTSSTEMVQITISFVE